jgi:hypothetical protein
MRSFPALGFDPAEGDAGSVAAALFSLATALSAMQETAPRLQEALDVSDDWSGDAADDFHDYGDDLPTALNSGTESMNAAATSLSKWQTQLMANQELADQYEREAKRLKDKLETADREVDAAAKALGSAKGDDYQKIYDNRYLPAVNEWSNLNNALQRVIDKARRLKDKHRGQAEAAADGIKGGPDDAFKPESDGALVQVFDGVAKASGIVSAVSTTIAAGSLVIPGVGEVVAPVAGTVAAGADGINTIAGIGQMITNSRNKPDLATLALGVLPGPVGPLKTFRKKVDDLGTPLTRAQRARNAGTEFITTKNAGAAYKNIKEIRQLAEQNGSLREALEAKARKDLRDKGDNLARPFADPENLSPATREALGRLRSSHEAFVGTVNSIVKTADAAGVELTPAQKRELELLKMATNPGVKQFENSSLAIGNETLKEQRGK